jgi:hypothetical protein
VHPFFPFGDAPGPTINPRILHDEHTTATLELPLVDRLAHWGQSIRDPGVPLEIHKALGPLREARRAVPTTSSPTNEGRESQALWQIHHGFGISRPGWDCPDHLVLYYQGLAGCIHALEIGNFPLLDPALKDVLGHQEKAAHRFQRSSLVPFETPAHSYDRHNTIEDRQEGNGEAQDSRPGRGRGR